MTRSTKTSRFLRFQFHYGTIKSLLSFPFLAFFYFNSTMVRLKERRRLTGIFRSRFQFHYGTIKRSVFSNTSPCHPHFNSTMVRLKVRAGFRRRRIKTFQFHYGTIKRACPCFSCSACIYINSTMVRLKGIRKETGKSVKHISIPLWYD